jgi:zinc transport system substrate-binding protein
VAVYQRADLVLRNGAGYARWMERATLRRRRVVDTSAAIEDRLIPHEAAAIHQHGPSGAHSHTTTAFTTWLDPQLAGEQARAVAEAFARERPEHEATFRAALAELEAELAALDARLAVSSARLGGAPVVFSHPVYAYLERRYDLNGRSLHWEPDELPDEVGWRELDVLLEEHPARLVLWEAEPLPETRRRLESRGLKSVVFAPGGGSATDGEDWLSLMNANATRLEEATAPPPEGGRSHRNLETPPPLEGGRSRRNLETPSAARTSAPAPCPGGGSPRRGVGVVET